MNNINLIMSYAQLRSFHALAIEGSIQKASERIFITQPAVSIQIKRLEAESRKRLFRRHGNTFELTQDGKFLLEATTRMFRAEKDAQIALSTTNGKYSGSMIIGTDGPHVALGIINKFKQQNPNIHIEVVLDNAQTTWSNLLELKVDIAILAGAPDYPGAVRKKVSTQRLLAVIPTQHDLLGKKSIRIEELVSYPLIFREQGSNTRTKINAALYKKDLSVDPLMTLGSREAVFEAVALGMGIGFAFEREVSLSTRYRSALIKGIDEINIDEMICLKEQASNPVVKGFFAHLECPQYSD